LLAAKGVYHRLYTLQFRAGGAGIDGEAD